MHSVKSVAATTLTVALLIGSVAFGVVTVGASPTTMTLQASVNPLTGVLSGGDMTGLYCFKVTDCIAVGNDPSSEPMVLNGNPASWTSRQAKQIVVASGGSLEAVTCTSATNCVAVGATDSREPLVLTGNPATWGAAQARVLDFSGQGDLHAITCTSPTACIATGDNEAGEPIQLLGNPATWTVAGISEINLSSAFGRGGPLTSIACRSSTKCVAVGSDFKGQPFTISGDPATWTAAEARQITLGPTFGSGGSLTSVACTSSTRCYAVGLGHDGRAITLIGNPATWTAAEVIGVAPRAGFSDEGNLLSIACPAVTRCTTVGDDSDEQPYELTGNPTTWPSATGTVLTLGRAFGSGGLLAAVSCPSGPVCVAVGNDLLGLPLSFTLKPTSRAMDQVELRGAALGANMAVTSLSCPSATSCVAVGHSNGTWPLAVQGNPSEWATAPVKQLTVSYFDSFASVDCTSTTVCVEVGTSSSGQPIVLRGNPTTWTLGDVKKFLLGTSYGSGGQFNGVTCTSSTLCVVVGSDRADQPIVLWGDPANWTASEVKPIALGASFDKGGTLNAVTCASMNACVAVGSDSADHVLVFSGNPATWSSADVKALVLSKALGTTGALNAVTCTSVTSCITVGEDGESDPLVLVGDPATWGAAQAFNVAVSQAAPDAVGGFTVGGVDTQGSFSSVSCSSATQCFAVGGDGAGAPVFIQGNPTKWEGQSIERPVGASSFDVASFGGSACVGSVCYVAGRAIGGVYLAPLSAK